MSLAEMYTAIDGNLEELLQRFGNETRVNKFLTLFLKDPSFSELQTAVSAADWDSAFRAAHTMKGVAANMSFTRLNRSASELTEALRGGIALENFALYDTVCADFNTVTENVRAYLASIG